MDRLKDKIAIVTGGASGIGRGIASLFAAEGARVVVADVACDRGEETVRHIKASGDVAAFVETDVSRAADVERMVQFTVRQFGRPSILCNNAGVMSIEPRLISDLTEETWDQVININLKGIYLCSKYTVPEMITAGGGAIVNVASIAGLVKSPNYAYAASKGGIIALTRSLAFGCGDHNIRANVICPGSIDTPGRARLRRNRTDRQDLSARVIQKDGTPEDIAHAAVYLASDESSFVTGSVLVVDGGSLRG
ncbi:MAG: glucose 1-dehydrogenase [Chloroflexi bacterium]|nr:glucose 1-dehydrogenase [Chloroflexota bacterium]